MILTVSSANSCSQWAMSTPPSCGTYLFSSVPSLLSNRWPTYRINIPSNTSRTPTSQSAAYLGGTDSRIRECWCSNDACLASLADRSFFCGLEEELGPLGSGGACECFFFFLRGRTVGGWVDDEATALADMTASRSRWDSGGDDDC